MGSVSDREFLLALREADKEAVATALAAAEKAVAAALAAAEKAVVKAEAASEKRFEGVNEFRATLTDQAATFLTRTEYEAKHEAVVDKLSVLENWRSKTLGAAAVLTLVSGAVGAAVAKALGV